MPKRTKILMLTAIGGVMMAGLNPMGALAYNCPNYLSSCQEEMTISSCSGDFCA